MIKEEPYTLRVPRSQRGGEVVEPLVRDQWFVKMGPLAERALAAVADGDVRIVPERFEKIYNHWLENIRVSPSRVSSFLSGATTCSIYGLAADDGRMAQRVQHATHHILSCTAGGVLHAKPC